MTGEFNPKRPVPCEAGCGLVIPKDELAEHNCVRELRALITSQQSKLDDFQQELAEQRLIINEHKRELALHKVSAYLPFHHRQARFTYHVIKETTGSHLNVLISEACLKV